MKLGKYNNLIMVKKTDFGVYLAKESAKDDKVLLPAKEVPEGLKIGDEIKVFLYKDSKDRLIATTANPFIELDGLAVLKVKEVGKIGAFLDWGLPKDLMLPYKEMNGNVRAGDEILVRMYIDKSSRLCASMKGLYKMLSTNAPYKVGDEVSGRIYEFGHDFGTFVALDDKYSAMIPRHEGANNLHIGDVVELSVTGVKEDGKVDVTLRKKAYLQMDEDAEALLELIESYGGVLPFTEKATPEVIMRECGLSKAAFKRAVGKLYKEKKISLEGGKIRKVVV